jgi:hypothetical protein
MFTKGPGLKLAMIEKNEFFRDQFEQCRSLAERARNKTDREFWLRLAQRWEALWRPNSLRATAPAVSQFENVVSGRGSQDGKPHSCTVADLQHSQPIQPTAPDWPLQAHNSR